MWKGAGRCDIRRRGDDLRDLRYGEARRVTYMMGAWGSGGRSSRASASPARTCSSARFTTFVREDDGPWRRGDERHENVLLDTARLPGVLAQHGLDVRVSSSFGGEELPPTAWTIVGRAVR